MFLVKFKPCKQVFAMDSFCTGYGQFNLNIKYNEIYMVILENICCLIRLKWLKLKKIRGSVGWACVAHLSFCFEET